MNKQTTDKVVMIRPSRFYYNEETAVNNAYQHNLGEAKEIVEKRAMEEFDELVKKMKNVGINVNVIQDLGIPYTPDSIFPNNWFSSHEMDKVVIYPMFADNRKLERKKFFKELINVIDEKNLEIIDLTEDEKNFSYLEGTGAMVLDRTNKIAYCTLSPRANMETLEKFCNKLNYKPLYFESVQEFKNGKKIPIYHTNVMMGIGEEFAVICLNSIENLVQKQIVIEELTTSKKEIVDISLEQVLSFAGNVIELKNREEKRYTLMSKTAYESFTEEQKKIIEKSSEIIYSDISTIETYGGGSVRCMIAEIY